ncbi:MAG: hypothetical protein RLZZ277_391 [Actinomycetota bacterium]
MASLTNFPGMAKNVSFRAKCPLQPGQPCNLCNADAYNGPQDCPVVALVMDDPQLRADLDAKRLIVSK